MDILCSSFASRIVTVEVILVVFINFSFTKHEKMLVTNKHTITIRKLVTPMYALFLYDDDENIRELSKDGLTENSDK